MALTDFCLFLLLAGVSDTLSAAAVGRSPRMVPDSVDVDIHYFPAGPYKTLSAESVNYVKDNLHRFTDACSDNVTCDQYVHSVNSSSGSNICANLAAYADCLDAICNNSAELEALTKSFGELCKDGSAFLYLSMLTLLLSNLTFNLLS